jgi:hypothetical protein
VTELLIVEGQTVEAGQVLRAGRKCTSVRGFLFKNSPRGMRTTANAKQVLVIYVQLAVQEW